MSWGTDDDGHTRVYVPDLEEAKPGVGIEMTRTLSPAEHAKLMAGVPKRAGMAPSAAPATTGLPQETRPAVHSARATAAIERAVQEVGAARSHLRRAGCAAQDLDVAEQLLLAILDEIHVRGWVS